MILLAAVTDASAHRVELVAGCRGATVATLRGLASPARGPWPDEWIDVCELDADGLNAVADMLANGPDVTACVDDLDGLRVSVDEDWDGSLSLVVDQDVDDGLREAEIAAWPLGDDDVRIWSAAFRAAARQLASV